MASVAPTPKLQFLDNAGNPLVGGKLYTYAAGTTTPLATYTNAGGLTSNANPVILDSRGEADVWLGTSQYKFKLTTSADVEVWTVDNLNAADAVTLAAALSGAAAAMAASNGSSLVGFIQSGTGAVATTVQAKLRESVSVKDFGAKGDANPISGAGTDDTAAIQAAINAVSVGHDQQRSVFFPDGTYKITSTITLPEGVELFGNGVWKSKLHYTGAGVAVQWTNGGTYDFPQIIRDIAMYGAGTYCIDTGATSGGIVRNVWFGGPGGIAIAGTADLWITDNGFDATSNGIVFTAASLCNNIEISRNLFTGNAYGITLKNARDVRINGNAFRGDATHNLHILCVSGTNTLSGIVINGNTFYTAAGVGAVGSVMINLQGSALTNFTISNNNFDGCRAQGIYCVSGSVVGVNIVGNTFSNIGNDVLYFVGVGGNVAIKNNIFSSAIAGKALNWNSTGVCTFSNNEVFAANSSALTGVNGAAVDVQQSALFVARGNTIVTSAVTYGFSIRSTVTVENAHDNIISGATVAEYSMANSSWAPMKLTGPINPGTLGAGSQANGLWAGSGVPSNTWGADGDWYMRTGTPGTANQRLYVKAAGAWVATAV